MMRPDAKVEKVYLYPKPVDFRKSIDGLAALVELDIKVAVFDCPDCPGTQLDARRL
ncbi:IS66 family insertion sequence element accessory protein TnpB [Pseudomonas tremae]|uniref:IS66 family insertion sequence element accessory protein TnpB n=1 Tax=Pseudomonas tremae TaxID=200454 RepID=UPI000515F05C|nr:IS66 family insertion sequence element accessory protein TnpB [Pseudomonas tremae]